MTRAIIWDRPGERVPEPGAEVRLDLAWPLFLPYGEPGSIGENGPRMLSIMSRWFWEYMGQITGRQRADAPETVWLVAPPLQPDGREYVTRLASFWCDEVYWDYPVAADAPNRWLAPTVDVGRLPEGPLWEAATERLPELVARYLTPMAGSGRVFISVREVAAGSASARLHSHTAADEYYLIVKGEGTLRMGRHRSPVSAGTLIAKPTGPALASHILADQGEPVTVLDLEVYADARLWGGTPELISYPDHHEAIAVGPGWENLIPVDSTQRTDDLFAHYFDGYVRQRDGTARPEALPGHAPRRDPSAGTRERD